MSQDVSEKTVGELWLMASLCLSAGELAAAKRYLDEIGLRFDDAYSRLESAVAISEKKEVSA